MAVKKHIALANEIRKDILAGKYGTEGGLPGLDELARRSGLARNTVRSALIVLEGERLIIERDRGYFVNTSSMVMTQYVPPLPLRMQAQGKTASSENIAITSVQLPDEIADLLHLGRGTIATFRFRVGNEVLESGEKKPFRLSKYYYLIPLNDEQVRQIEENADADLLVQYAPLLLTAHDEISSRLPTKEEASYLHIPESTPVTHVQIITKDTSGRILLFQELTLLGVTLAYDYSFENRPKA
jgi:DNA-binding GntR family transcriptional regulator